MNQLLTHVHDTSSAYLHNHSVNSTKAREERILLFCEILQSTIMLNIAVADTDGGCDVNRRDPGSLILDLSSPKGCALLSDIMNRFPFLCCSYIWMHVRCVSIHSYSCYLTVDPVCAEQQALLAKRIICCSSNSMNVRNVPISVTEGRSEQNQHNQVSLIPLSTADCIAECTVQVLLNEQLVHFLNWECMRDSGLNIRSVDEQRTFFAVWNILLQARVCEFLHTDMRSNGGRKEQIQSDPSLSMNAQNERKNALINLTDDTVDFTVSAVQSDQPVEVMNVYNNPPRDLISSGDVSVTSLKSVWSALLCCSNALVDWSTSHAEVTSTTMDASSRIRGSNKINGKYDQLQLQVNDITDAFTTIYKIAVPVIIKDIISRLVCCLQDACVDQYTAQDRFHGEIHIFNSQSGMISMSRTHLILSCNRSRSSK